MRARTQSVPTDLRKILKPFNLPRESYNLFWEILISPHSNMTGVFECSKWYLCGDMEWDLPTVEEHLGRLVELGAVHNDETRGLLMVDPTLGMNPMEEFRTSFAVNCALKVLHKMPQSKIFKPLHAHLETLNKPLLNPILRKLKELYRNTEKP